jgi:hypothetical protein
MNLEEYVWKVCNTVECTISALAWQTAGNMENLHPISQPILRLPA